MYMPEHISGTGDAMDMPGIETYGLTGHTSSTNDFRAVEAGHDQFFIPEEAVSSIYESADYMHYMSRFADQLAPDADAHCEVDPIRQIKTVREQLREFNSTLNEILEENANRDRREQFIWAGLAGLAVITLISLFRK